MKYFAKYLPVEGEIKEGDKKLLKTGAIVTNYDKADTNKELNDFLEAKPVKLFLCSIDIQVGDKVRYYDTPEYEFNAHEKDVASKNEFGTFKVIGEISSDALSYVKEGDEFEEDKIFNLMHHNAPKIQIKGPCGHFH